ncbi:Hsp20/alpha crystallin family protein [Limobrevibacterium gyesilva]|uniref:Hsp20/alpha crystallin family protein n=1 Tax=Limobrevibacterium gyesilva TaxID=2991712 RepID=A0AA41YR36_9PROT|nr:Hsp20/alpha crystallin family protein [Limobrevibacterium gyesilva]MCW3477176.1 Hsp20/alpha crystallin family protein [Limobrevibacterium gyesilva]
MTSINARALPRWHLPATGGARPPGAFPTRTQEDRMDMRDLIPWARSRAMTRAGEADPFSALQREMSRMIEDVWRGFGAPAAGAWPSLAALPGAALLQGAAWPSLDVSETDSAYVINAEVPGMDEKDIELSLTDDMLTIKGEKKSETKDEAKRLSERFYGRFERRIPLGSDIDRDKVTAEFKNGVLSITLPKNPTAAAQARRISISKSA